MRGSYGRKLGSSGSDIDVSRRKTQRANGIIQSGDLGPALFHLGNIFPVLPWIEFEASQDRRERCMWE